MSHAWNACGFHDPRGFKSHILRAFRQRTRSKFSPGALFSFLCLARGLWQDTRFRDLGRRRGISPGRARCAKEFGARFHPTSDKRRTPFLRPGLLPPPPTRIASIVTHVRDKTPDSGILGRRRGISPGRVRCAKEFGARISHEEHAQNPAADPKGRGVLYRRATFP